ncbi:MAG: LacI family transcriptional regulator [Eubacteriales bacterium]|nr:LacI family transcriptional regulator [Eubacteriales bacterium]
MNATIKDIALECCVSTATVSLALAGKKGRVSAETTTRILETAARLQYTPNRAAVSLATHHTKLVGVLMSDLRNTHIAQLFMAIEEVLQSHGYTLICHVLDDKTADIGRISSELNGSGVEGILYAHPIFLDPDESFYRIREFLNNAGVPIICNEDVGLTCAGMDVIFDFYQAGYLATRHLIECGHQVIGCVSGPANYRVSEQRLRGYRDALEEGSIAYDPKLVYYGDYSTAGAEPALSYLLGQKTTAIFSFNDEMAFALYRSAHQYGLSIPQDISVIGCDNVPFCNVLEVPLSTVHVPAEEMGREMAESLITAIEESHNKSRTQHIYAPALILRGSVNRRYADNATKLGKY